MNTALASYRHGVMANKSHLRAIADQPLFFSNTDIIENHFGNKFEVTDRYRRLITLIDVADDQSTEMRAFIGSTRYASPFETFVLIKAGQGSIKKQWIHTLDSSIRKFQDIGGGHSGTIEELQEMRVFLFGERLVD